jgi:outer membrane protein OmpA-like peptidoglycan-associated protein
VNRLFRTFCLVALAAAHPRTAAAQEKLPPVDLDAFRAGVRIPTLARYEVRDITVGRRSVRGLFRATRARRPYPADPGRQEAVVLAVSRDGNLAALQNAMRAERDSVVRVHLDDPASDIWRQGYRAIIRRLPGSKPFAYEVEVAVRAAPAPCALVTRIIYRRINEIVRQQLESSGLTRARVSMGDVFVKLLDDQLDAFMGTLDPANRSTECVRTFELLKWIRGDSVTAFGFGEYTLQPRLLGVLDTMVAALLAGERTWQAHRVEIDAVGFTDSVEVQTGGFDFSFGDSGLPARALEGRGPEIYFGGCTGDVLDAANPAYVPLNSASVSRVGRRIDNNCELSAVRGYLVTRYLATALASRGVRFRYAAGGESTVSATTDRNRRVDVVITVRAGSEDRPMHR